MIIERGGVRLDESTHLSFQRYPEHEFRTGSTAPTSHGALPVGLSRQNQPLVPMAEGEALWIGLRSLDSAHAVGISATFGLRRGDVLTKHNSSIEVEVPARVSAVTIIWRIDAAGKMQSPILFRSRQGNDECDFIDIALHSQRNIRDLTSIFHFQFCSYDHFTRATGIAAPPPLQEMTSYRRWLLP